MIEYISPQKKNYPHYTFDSLNNDGQECFIHTSRDLRNPSNVVKQ